MNGLDIDALQQWRALPEADRRDVLAGLRSLREDWEGLAENPETPLNLVKVSEGRIQAFTLAMGILEAP